MIQDGFREKRSCNDAKNADKFHEYITWGKKKRQVFSFDLPRAFDILDHEFRRIKLEKYGFEGTILKTHWKYFSEQFVGKNGNQSNNLYVKSDVPQDSVQGTLVFLRYGVDLRKVKKDSQMVIFAYDTTITDSGENWPEIWWGSPNNCWLVHS